MAFAFRRDETIAEGAARVAGRQLDKATDALDQADEATLAAAVHGIRKRTKQVRAVGRLVRSGVGKGYGKVNVAARDAAQLLSSARDATALLATFDALVAGAGSQGAAVDVLPVRQGLARRAETSAEAEIDVDRAIELLTHARRGVDRWTFAEGPAVLAAGLDTTYRRGRDGFRASLADPSAASFHEWRKATKHLWHQTQLLEPAAPSVLHAQAQAFHDLADTLGDDHDLAVLIDLLKGDGEAFGGVEPVEAAMALAAERRADLEDRALRLGARLYVERPSAFVARMTGLWQAWLDHGDELPAGEIAAIAPTDDGLHGHTRAELYALAREGDLPGRSQMGRTHLIASLRASGR